MKKELKMRLSPSSDKRSSGLLGWYLLSAIMVLATASPSGGGQDQCAEANPLNNLYFGDLHSHTSFSFDAVSFGTRTTPRDAYRFAKGAPIVMPPYEKGKGNRTNRLKRPLDFLAVTDHAEYFGEVQICLRCADPDGSRFDCDEYRYDTKPCSVLRDTAGEPDGEGKGFALWGAPLTTPDPPRFPMCQGNINCLAVTANVWDEVVSAAEDANDPCSFTAFAAYEWSGAPGGANWHRNVIFRNSRVPGLPPSVLDTGRYHSRYGTHSATRLWKALDELCVEGVPGCDVLAIPHNFNLSTGKLSQHQLAEDKETVGILPIPETAAAAEYQTRFERLGEIHQTKGVSECRWGVGNKDELCQFELKTNLQLRGNQTALGPVDPERSGEPLSGEAQGFVADPDTGNTFNAFLREILKGGLYLGDDLGINPYKIGFVGGTDTHASTPGATEETGFQGHHGAPDDDPEERLSVEDDTHNELEKNPGGLTAVWARENTRDAIFDALHRRESYGTSGIRPQVRFFGGWEYPEGLCDSPDFVEVGYEKGVPMGSDLGPRPDGVDARPTFAVMAMKDPSSDIDTRLQRIQIIKGWLDADGELHEKVHDAISHPGDPSSPSVDAYVDLSTCEVKDSGLGRDVLCTVWHDDDFDPSEPSFYYARVLENPTCRWSTRQCLALGGEEHPCWTRLTTPAGADDDTGTGVTVELTIQERAWTSSIWYQPAVEDEPL